MKKGIYEHYKGKRYRLLGVATHSETLEKMIVYEALYEGGGVWVRPYEMFNSEVDHEKYPDVGQQYRFEEIRD